MLGYVTGGGGGVDCDGDGLAVEGDELGLVDIVGLPLELVGLGLDVVGELDGLVVPLGGRVVLRVGVGVGVGVGQVGRDGFKQVGSSWAKLKPNLGPLDIRTEVARAATRTTRTPRASRR